MKHAASAHTIPPRPPSLIFMATLSLLAHLILLFSLHLPLKEPRKPASSLLEVSLLPLERQSETPRQIVSPPDIESSEAPSKASKLAEFDSRAEKETVKRGEPMPFAASEMPATQTDRTATRKAPPSAGDPAPARADETGVSQPDLFLPRSELDDTIASKAAGGAAPKERAKESKYADDASRELTARLSAPRGTPDFLPNVPEGSLTLLNAKAYRFAPFVRRVAERVFGELRAGYWSSVGRGDLLRASSPVILEATLSGTGELLEVRVSSSSGSSAFDEALKRAVELGAWDRNPPSGAQQSDGTIQFLFQCRAGTRPAPNVRGETRWLVLGTGLM